MNGGNAPNQMPNGISAPQVSNIAMQNALMQQQQARNQQRSPFPPTLVPAQQPTPVPRNGPTPLQQQQIAQSMFQRNLQTSPQPPMANQSPMQPNAGPSAPSMAEQNSQSTGQPKYMSRQEFSDSLRRWYTTHSVKPDINILQIGNRQVQPYDLFTEVMQMGGFLMVRRRLAFLLIVQDSIFTRFNDMICGMSSQSKWAGRRTAQMLIQANLRQLRLASA